MRKQPNNTQNNKSNNSKPGTIKHSVDKPSFTKKPSRPVRPKK